MSTGQKRGAAARITPTNEHIAHLLEQIAELLETHNGNPHRIRAYRHAAITVRSARQPLADMVRAGDGDALRRLPGIGSSIAATIAEIVRTGRSSVLDRLQGQVSPEALFIQVPGIGEQLAHRIAAQLDIHTLEELEQAAHDGRLDQVEGFGPKRVQAVRVSLAGMLSQSAWRRRRQRMAGNGNGARSRPEPPSVAMLLDVDAEYRRRAIAGDLYTIAPRRFNPERIRWLPIMHTERDGWNFTVLYSNTARAHELDKTHDWVVIYYERAGYEEQATVVTETWGLLQGLRVVRRREAECRRYYEWHAQAV